MYIFNYNSFFFIIRMPPRKRKAEDSNLIDQTDGQDEQNSKKSKNETLIEEVFEYGPDSVQPNLSWADCKSPKHVEDHSKVEASTKSLEVKYGNHSGSQIIWSDDRRPDDSKALEVKYGNNSGPQINWSDDHDHTGDRRLDCRPRRDGDRRSDNYPRRDDDRRSDNYPRRDDNRRPDYSRSEPRHDNVSRSDPVELHERPRYGRKQFVDGDRRPARNNRQRSFRQREKPQNKVLFNLPVVSIPESVWHAAGYHPPIPFDDTQAYWDRWYSSRSYKMYLEPKVNPPPGINFPEVQ